MRKNTMKVALVAAVAAMAGYGVYAHQTKEMMSDMMLENVEALATGEVSPTECPGGRHLCAWIHDPLGSTTYYDENGPDDI